MIAFITGSITMPRLAFWALGVLVGIGLSQIWDWIRGR